MKSRMAQRSPRPFSIGVPVRATRLRGLDAAELLGGLAGRVLDALGLVEHEPLPLDGGQRLDVAHAGAVGGEHDVGALDLAGQVGDAGPAGAVVDDDLAARA